MEHTCRKVIHDFCEYVHNVNELNVLDPPHIIFNQLVQFATYILHHIEEFKQYTVEIDVYDEQILQLVCHYVIDPHCFTETVYVDNFDVDEEPMRVQLLPSVFESHEWVAKQNEYYERYKQKQNYNLTNRVVKLPSLEQSSEQSSEQKSNQASEQASEASCYECASVIDVMNYTHCDNQIMIHAVIDFVVGKMILYDDFDMNKYVTHAINLLDEKSYKYAMLQLTSPVSLSQVVHNVNHITWLNDIKKWDEIANNSDVNDVAHYIMDLNPKVLLYVLENTTINVSKAIEHIHSVCVSKLLWLEETRDKLLMVLCERCGNLLLGIDFDPHKYTKLVCIKLVQCLVLELERYKKSLYKHKTSQQQELIYQTEDTIDELVERINGF